MIILDADKIHELGISVAIKTQIYINLGPSIVLDVGKLDPCVIILLGL